MKTKKMKLQHLKLLLITLIVLSAAPIILAQDEQADEANAITLAEEQLVAYNQRDIEAFLAPYSDDVKVYKYPNTLLYEGKEKMRAVYAKMFEETPELHCDLVNRISMGNTVIDQELVTISKDKKPFGAIAIYKIEQDQIVEVRFIQ